MPRAPAGVWIPAVAVPLLVVLGVLQFRWLGELSERDRESRQTRLAADATRFSEDFDRELTRAYVAFQPDGDAVERRDGHDAADRYRLWKTQTRHPHLVRDIWIAEFVPQSSQDKTAIGLLQDRTVQLSHTGRPVVAPALVTQSAPSGGSVRLPTSDSQMPMSAQRAAAGQASWRFLRLDTDKPALTEQALPPELGGLRRRLSLSIALPSVGDEPQQHNLYLNPIDEETLSILAPIAMQVPMVSLPVAASAAGTTFVGTFHQPSPALRFVIIQLDRQYIADELLPALSRQYFAEPIGSGQLQCRVSVVRARDPRTLVYASHPGSQDVTAAADATAPLLGVRTSNMIQQVATPNGRFDRGAVTDAGSGHWQLRVTHLAGSLQALAERTRRQNLLASSSILALLAGSLVLLLVALRRARALTRQQLEFVAGVSHELRTPVAVVCATGDNLADGVVSDPEQVRRYGRLIRREGRRLMEMTEQVLSFARIESTSPPLLEPTAVETLVRRAVESMQPQIDDAECRCVVVLQDSLPTLLVDRASIERAIQNLISNALKYNNERHEIRISAGVQTLRAGSRVWIAVEDRGIGIHADELSLIFEPFRRGRAAIERNLRGTGLGLSLVRRIMQAHGGEVCVRSELDLGSTFTLYLPVPQSPAAALS